MRLSRLPSLRLDDSLEPAAEDAAAEPLAVPDDPLEELEWLLSFFDDRAAVGLLKADSGSSECEASDTRGDERRWKREDIDLKHETCEVSSDRVTKPRRRQCGRRLWSLEPPQLSGAARRCAHCLTAETPQWRAGPQGPGTLCNACGIRFTSGRLLPEYRPSTGQAFCPDYSNRHREVMNIRKRKQ